ncbi:MAG: glycosyltransferase [Polyangiaceae bacterium]
MKTLVVLPSYNEALNIVQVTQAILDANAQASVCIVDDSSPDGTADLLRTAIGDKPAWRDRVHLIVRAKKDGRGGAVRDGFSWGLSQAEPFAAFVEMDCDFSHEPSAIPEGLALLEAGNDVVIGARYPNGTIIGWPARWRAFSFAANLLARSLLSWSVADFTNGFRFYSPRAVQVLISKPQQHKGYIYLSESLSYLLNAGFRVASFPITFKNRDRGVSNTTASEILHALRGIVLIGISHHRRSS